MSMSASIRRWWPLLAFAVWLLLFRLPVLTKTKTNFYCADKGESWKIFDNGIRLRNSTIVPYNSAMEKKQLITLEAPAVVHIKETQGSRVRWVQVKTKNPQTKKFIVGWIFANQVQNGVRIR